MRSKVPALQEATLGAWLVKARPEGLPLREVLLHGFESVTSRCVRASYRTELIRAGQPVLLWVSGGDRDHAAGIYAVGETTGPAHRDSGQLAMPVRLRGVAPVVTREELMARPELSGLEVIRMPAGSNPSYVDTVHLETLLATYPQLSSGRR